MALPEAWAPYARLIVTVQGPAGDFEIIPTSPGVVGMWPDELPSPLYVMTAWDPGTERPGVEANRRRQNEFEEELALYASGMWRAAGRGPIEGSADEGVVVAGLSAEEAVLFARRFGQDAIFEWTPRRWSIVSTGDEPRLDAGWALARQDVSGAGGTLPS